MTDPVEVALELGPKGKKFVAYAPAWPGWSRGAKSEVEAIETLESYRERYRPVAERAGFGVEFAAAGEIDVVERYVGTGSTDFWGISFSASPGEIGPMSEDVHERKLALLQACWSYFDDVLGRVTPELKKGPRGGGRDRDDILNHTYGTERTQMAVKVGVRTPQGVMLTPEGLARHREEYLAAFREYNAEGRKARTWELQFLLRHTAYHMMDHAWEMEDKTLG
jgi:hypothetical protein